MTNPIDNGSRVGRGTPTGVTENRAPETRTESATAGRRDPGVGADSSQLSERLQAVRAAIDSAPEVNNAKVEEIRARIAAGEYPLDADRIASRFIEFERLLNDGGR
jgi:negative regulator of flagellin synthesis FlgM